MYCMDCGNCCDICYFDNCSNGLIIFDDFVCYGVGCGECMFFVECDCR